MANIKINGSNSGQFNIADNGSTMTVIIFNSELEKFKNELEQFMQQADENNKQVIYEALTAIKQKDEGEFKKALKKAASFISSVASKLTASILFEYMKQNGLTP